MKNLILLFSILALTFGVNAQQLKNADIPAKVKANFESMFANAKDVTWEMEKDLYEAEFMNDQIATSVLFKKDGTYMQTEVEMLTSDLPDMITEFVLDNFDGEKITEAIKITDATGTVTYEIEVEGTGFLFDADGNFITDIEEDMDEDGDLDEYIDDEDDDE